MKLLRFEACGCFRAPSRERESDCTFQETARIEITLWNRLFTYFVVAVTVGAFIGGLRKRLRRPLPDLAVPPLAHAVDCDCAVPLLLYRVLRVLFRSFVLRSSALAGGWFAGSGSALIVSWLFSEHALQICWLSSVRVHSSDSVHSHCVHFRLSIAGAISHINNFTSKTPKRSGTALLSLLQNNSCCHFGRTCASLSKSTLVDNATRELSTLGLVFSPERQHKGND